MGGGYKQINNQSGERSTSHGRRSDPSRWVSTGLKKPSGGIALSENDLDNTIHILHILALLHVPSLPACRNAPLKKTPCTTNTEKRKNGPGCFSLMKVNKCMRSFSASSNKVWIHPWSLFIRRRLCKWRIMPAAIPGMPARKGRKGRGRRKRRGRGRRGSECIR